MKLRRNLTKFSFRREEIKPVPIVGDGAIATGPTAEGRLIPLVIVDTTERPDIVELVRVHEFLPPGDVTSHWGQLPKRNETILLILQWEKPTKVAVLLEFDIVKQGGIVDQILNSRGFYLQPGKPGDRVSTTLRAKKILVEIPDMEFARKWDRLLKERLIADFRRRGLSKSEAKEAASKVVDAWREFSSFRIPRRS